MSEQPPEIHDPAKFTWQPGDVVWGDEEQPTTPGEPAVRDHRGRYHDHGKNQATTLGEEIPEA